MAGLPDYSAVPFHLLPSSYIRVSITATTPSHAATALRRAISTSQRVSSKVLASAGSRARLRNQCSPPGVVHRAQDLEMPTSRSHDLRAVEMRTGVLGRGCLVSSYGGNRSFLLATRLLCLAALFCWALRGRRAIFTSLLSSSVPVACGPCPKSQGCSARSLGGRESCFIAGVTLW